MVKIMGHRGAAFYEPENTLRSFARALEMGVAAVELDVQLTADGRLAVIHDETVDRTTNGTGRVKDFTLAALKTLDAGQGEPIPSLEEVVDLVQGRAHLVVELKQPDAARPLLRFIQAGRGLAAAHAAGLHVYIWNIDSPETLKPYLSLNLDGIGSNRPDVLIKYLEERGEGQGP